MTHIPAEDLATEIATQIGSLTLGTNIFHSMMRAPDSVVPKACVFVWGSGGPAPERTMGDPDEIRRAIVSVQVRNPKHKLGSDLIHEIVDALRGDDIATYLEVKVGMSEPLSFGQDTDGLHIFATNYVMTYLEP